MKADQAIKNSILYFDGGTGTLLQQRGLLPGELPESWNITRADEITKLHLEYLSAGADIIKTNTFGANSLKFENYAEVIQKGIMCAKEAVRKFGAENKFVAYDIGPLGKILKPFGDMDFEDAVSVFANGVRAAEAVGADIILIETMNDAYETKAAVLAAKENSSLPIFVTNVYDDRGKLMTGADVKAMVALLEGLGVCALGANCSLGPKEMLAIVRDLKKYSSLPIIINPNAGLPRACGGKTIFDVDADEFSDIMAQIAKCGATLLGGCCGTTPEYIKATVEKTRGIPFALSEEKNITLVSSYTSAVEIGGAPVLIGERINPTGKKKFKEALRAGDMDYILSQGFEQVSAGAHILDVNVGLPEIDECEVMKKTVFEIQSVIDTPLCLDTVNARAMEQAMRIYNGKPLVNSVNGKEESLAEILPLVKKYGGSLIALTLDENGIPNSSQKRFEIAEKIVAAAEKSGIRRREIIVDPLAMTISSEADGANIAIETIKLVKEKLGVKCSLGVSNISFGLPCRDFVTAAFYMMASAAGLDCAIMNVLSTEMMKAYRSFMALKAYDKNCADYIAFASGITGEQTFAGAKNLSDGSADTLKDAIMKGLSERAKNLAAAYLENKKPIDIIDGEIIPALDEVGKGFEEKRIFLPSLLMSAEAAGAAFEEVKRVLPPADGGGKIILATVKGDIHDIGKNIVKVLLQNYGFSVIDLGRDVAPDVICKAAVENNIKLVGLSALMTTTVPSMEETIKLLRAKMPSTKIMVGGAVLTQEYADMIGADFYGRDAMQSVRYAESILK